MNHDEKHDLKIDTTLLDELTRNAEKMNRIPLELYEKYSVKRGLRNEDGTGVLVGLTEIGDVHGYIIDEGRIVRSIDKDDFWSTLAQASLARF